MHPEAVQDVHDLWKKEQLVHKKALLVTVFDTWTVTLRPNSEAEHVAALAEQAPVPEEGI